MKLNTVSVIEEVSNSILKLASFKDDDEGNKEAEKLFWECALENGAKKHTKAVLLEDGYFVVGTYKLFLTHSTN